jgi:hypothetical protein
MHEDINTLIWHRIEQTIKLSTDIILEPKNGYLLKIMHTKWYFAYYRHFKGVRSLLVRYHIRTSHYIDCIDSHIVPDYLLFS